MDSRPCAARIAWAIRGWRPSPQVSPAHAHPFTAGEDFCLVHNGSLSNPYSLRRLLEERASRIRNRQRHRGRLPLFEWRMREGDTIEQALGAALREDSTAFTLF